MCSCRHSDSSDDNPNLIMKHQNPYKPVATLDEVMGYQPEKPSTYTKSPLVNAVIEALLALPKIAPGIVAEYLALDRNALSKAMTIELGMTLSELVVQFRIKRHEEYRRQHPEASSDELARAAGFEDRRGYAQFRDSLNGVHRDGDRGKRD